MSSRRDWAGERWPWRLISQCSLQVCPKSISASRSSSMVAKGPVPEQALLQIKRSAQPFSSGVRMNAEDPASSHANSRCTSRDMYWLPVGGTDGEDFRRHFFDAAEALGDALPNHLQRLVPCPMQGDDHRDRAVPEGQDCGHVGAQNRVARLALRTCPRKRAVHGGRPNWVVAEIPFSRIGQRTRASDNFGLPTGSFM